MATTGLLALDLTDDIAHVIDTAPIPGWRLSPESHGAVRAVTAAARPVLPDEAVALLGALSDFYATMALPPTTYDAAVAELTKDRVDGWAASLDGHPATVAESHRLLTEAGRVANPDGWPPLLGEATGPWIPYRWAEVRSLYGSLGRLPWLDATRTFGVLTVGLAVGGTEADLPVVSGEDIHIEPDGVRVRLSAPDRMVPAAWPYRWPLTRLAVHRRGHILSGVGPMSSDALDGLPDRIACDDAPRLTLSRLRATWLASHLVAGTPLHLLARVAGPTLLDDVARVLPHLPPMPAVAARRWLTLGGAA